MTSPDVPDADAFEQRLTPTGEEPTPDVDVAPDEPEADVLEQSQPVGTPPHLTRGDVPLEADPADAEEQSLTVPLDEDEGRAED